jgi:hypothetical protein
MTKTRVSIGALVAVAGMAAAAHGTILTSDTFTYPDGNLVGNGGWTAHSGAGVVPVQVVSGRAVLSQGTLTREDVNTPFSAIGAGQAVYASFLFSNSGGAGTVYFAHLQSTATTFRARVFITAPTAGGDYTVGFSDTSTLGPVWGTDLVFGTEYLAIIAYEFDTGASRLWIDPVSEASTNLAVAGIGTTPLNAFSLRQANPTVGTSMQTIDNLIVATSFAEVIPSPGGLALLTLGGLIATRRRRA